MVSTEVLVDNLLPCEGPCLRRKPEKKEPSEVEEEVGGDREGGRGGERGNPRCHWGLIPLPQYSQPEEALQPLVTQVGVNCFLLLGTESLGL